LLATSFSDMPSLSTESELASRRFNTEIFFEFVGYITN